MGDRPRQRRAKAWVWVYLALFRSDSERTNNKTESADQACETTSKTSDGPETK
jgi:hypothetical protein